MEYTVGSVADLISGNRTSKKSKVIKKEIINTSVVSMLGSSPGKVLKGKKPRKRKMKVEKKEDDSIVVITPEDMDAVDEEQGSGKESDDEDQKEIKPERVFDPVVKAEIDARTVFVGNVPVTVSKDKLMRHFRPYGRIHSVRLRCLAPENPTIDKRTVAIKHLVHPKRNSMNAYVVFYELKGALKSLALNGTIFENHYIRVTDLSDASPAVGKAIFIGQLDFEAEDNDLWEAFKSCGEIESVRVLRGKFGVGTGVGYVNFKSADSVELALQMEDVKIGKRVCRITRCNNPKKNMKPNRKFVGKKEKGLKKNFKRFGNVLKTGKNENVPKTDKDGADVKKQVYRGRVAQKLNKKKYNKEMAQKLKMAGKVAPRMAAK